MKHWYLDLNVKVRQGKLPLSKLKEKERAIIEEALRTKVSTAFEVAWPHEGIMGRKGKNNKDLKGTNFRGTYFCVFGPFREIKFHEIYKLLLDREN